MDSKKNKKNVSFEGKIRRSMMLLFLVIIITIVGNIILVFSQIAQGIQDSNTQTGNTVVNISQKTNESQISDELRRLTEEKATKANEGFSILSNTVNVMKENAELLYANEDDYGSVKVYPPKKENADVLSVQVTYSASADPDDPAIQKEQGLIGNLGALLYSINDNNSSITSCYFATETGIMLQADRTAGYQFDEKGNIKTFEAKERPWYKGAVKKKGTYFTDVIRDADTGKFAIVCAAPIYKGKELVGVAGAGMLLSDFESIIDDAELNDLGAAFIVDNKGNLIITSDEDYVWKSNGEELVNLLDEDNELSDKLSEFLKSGKSSISKITLGRETYYISCSTLDEVGWGFVSILPEYAVNETTIKLVEELKDTNQETNSQMYNIMNTALVVCITTIVVLAVIITWYIRRLTARLLKPIKGLTRKVSSLKGNNLAFDWENRTGDEIDMLGMSFKSLTERVQQYITDITIITAEKERIGAELSVATQIQEDMLPRIFPPYPNLTEFDLFASMNPAKEVGGDFYDFFLVDDTHLAMVMADVSGKGVPAALFMVIAKTLIKNRAQMGGTPAEILSDVNDQLCENNEADLFVTVWLAILDVKTGKGIAANAGHEHPVLIHKGEKPELVVYRHSPAVASIEGIRFREHEFELAPGDRLFVYTDGVPEATNAHNELFGTDRMLNVLNENAGAPVKKLLAALKSEIDSFVGDAPQFDDVTMLCLDYYGSKEDSDLKESEIKEITIEAKEEKLDQLLDFVNGNLENMDCPKKIQTQIDVTVEELFVNIAKYAYTPNSGTADIKMEMLRNPDRVSITFADSGIPYNPLEKIDPDITLSLDERPIGGLGIYMVKKRMDEVNYEYRDNQNVLTIIKNFQ